ncbi:MAG: TerD family protein [Bacteroidales bacterium]|jgi:tellurium resistance protein TerD|nr:TerD family protein [Bacteroidales bacterium]
MARFDLAKQVEKGERFDLTKSQGGLLQARIGLGWQENENPDGPQFDLDVSAFMIGSDFKIPDDGFFVFYGCKKQGKWKTEKSLRPLSQDEALYGAVDEKEGSEEGEEGDTEDMILDLSKVDPRVEQIIIVVTICKYPNDENRDRRTLALNFGMVEGCYLRIINEKTGAEIMRYTLSENFKNEDAVEFGRLYRLGEEWEFEALGRGSQGSLPALIEQYT